MGLSVWRETSKKLTVYRVCYTPIETLFTYSFETQACLESEKRRENHYHVVPSRVKAIFMYSYLNMPTVRVKVLFPCAITW